MVNRGSRFSSSPEESSGEHGSDHTLVSAAVLSWESASQQQGEVIKANWGGGSEEVEEHTMEREIRHSGRSQGVWQVLVSVVPWSRGSCDSVISREQIVAGSLFGQQ